MEIAFKLKKNLVLQKQYNILYYVDYTTAIGINSVNVFVCTRFFRVDRTVERLSIAVVMSARKSGQSVVARRRGGGLHDAYRRSL